MKIAIYSILTILLIVIGVEAKSTTETIQIGNSIELRNQNITLMDLNVKNENAIICVNGIKTIVSENKVKKIGEVVVDLKNVQPTSVRIKLESNCKNCILNDNTICFNECQTNLNCNDNNELTSDSCTGTPKKCIYEEIIVEEQIIVEDPKEINIVLNLDEKTLKKPQTFLERFLNWLKNVF